MGHKSRHKRERRGEGPKKTVLAERTQVGPFVMEQAGRYVRMRSLLDEAGAARMRQQLRDAVPKLKTDIKTAIADLAAICSRVNPFELLAVNSHTNCEGDPEQYTESSAKGNEAYAEYLLSVVLAVPFPKMDVHATEEDFAQVKKQIETIFECTMLVSNAESLDEAHLNDPMRDLCGDVYLMNLFVRGHSYFEHHMELVRRVFEPHDVFFEKHFGVSARACINGMVEVGNQVNKRFTELFTAIRDMPKYLTEFDGTENSLTAGEGDIALLADRNKLIEKMEAVRDFMSPEGPYEITPNERVPYAYLERVSASWNENADFLKHENWGGWPSAPSIVTSKPLIRHEGKFYAFVPQILARYMFETFEKWIRDADPRYFDRTYQKTRGEVLETLALEHLRKLLPGCQSYHQLHYVYAHDGVSESGEVDGVVLFDNVVFIIEAKAGAFSASAKRGGEERIRKHIGELIDKAYEQGKRALAFIKSEDEVTFQDDRGKDVLSLCANDYTRFYLVNVTLDCQERIFTQLNSLRAMSFLQGENWPWTVFINDLRVISEIIESPCEFLLYLDRRIRANDIPEFSVFDELDYLMHFLKDGLFLETLERGENQSYGLVGYTEELDRYYDYLAGRVSSGKKPQLAIPEKMRTFVQRIEQCGCAGFAGVGARLLMYDYNEQVQVSENIDRIVAECSQDGRDRDVTLTSHHTGHGVSIIASRDVFPALQSRVENFARLRQYETQATIWDIIVLSSEPSGDYTVSVRVLSGVPPRDPELDRRVQEHQDQRFKRAVRLNGVPGRNDPCPCGSGKKFKRCHGN